MRTPQTRHAFKGRPVPWGVWHHLHNNSHYTVVNSVYLDTTWVLNCSRFVNAMHVITALFEDLVETGHLKFLSLYKFSQDHLELFFGAIRSRLGANTNPDTVQFKSSYKRLLVHNHINGTNGNGSHKSDEINSKDHNLGKVINGVNSKTDNGVELKTSEKYEFFF